MHSFPSTTTVFSTSYMNFCSQFAQFTTNSTRQLLFKSNAFSPRTLRDTQSQSVRLVFPSWKLCILVSKESKSGTFLRSLVEIQLVISWFQMANWTLSSRQLISTGSLEGCRISLLSLRLPIFVLHLSKSSTRVPTCPYPLSKIDREEKAEESIRMNLSIPMCFSENCLCRNQFCAKFNQSSRDARSWTDKLSWLSVTDCDRGVQRSLLSLLVSLISFKLFKLESLSIEFTSYEILTYSCWLLWHTRNTSSQSSDSWTRMAQRLVY